MRNTHCNLHINGLLSKRARMRERERVRVFVLINKQSKRNKVYPDYNAHATTRLVAFIVSDASNKSYVSFVCSEMVGTYAPIKIANNLEMELYFRQSERQWHLQYWFIYDEESIYGRINYQTVHRYSYTYKPTDWQSSAVADSNAPFDLFSY